MNESPQRLVFYVVALCRHVSRKYVLVPCEEDLKVKWVESHLTDEPIQFCDFAEAEQFAAAQAKTFSPGVLHHMKVVEVDLDD